MPVHVAHGDERQPVELLQRVHRRRDEDVIDVEHLLHAQHVPPSHLRPVVAVVRHEQRIETQLVLDHMGLEVAVLAAAHRHYAVVARAVA